MTKETEKNIKEIPGQFNRLKELHDVLSNKVHVLSERLIPIKSQTVSLMENPRDCKSIDELSPFAAELGIQCDIIEGLILTIDDVLDRIEL